MKKKKKYAINVDELTSRLYKKIGKELVEERVNSKDTNYVSRKRLEFKLYFGEQKLQELESKIKGKMDVWEYEFVENFVVPVIFEKECKLLLEQVLKPLSQINKIDEELLALIKLLSLTPKGDYLYVDKINKESFKKLFDNSFITMSYDSKIFKIKEILIRELKQTKKMVFNRYNYLTISNQEPEKITWFTKIDAIELKTNLSIKRMIKITNMCCGLLEVHDEKNKE